MLQICHRAKDVYIENGLISGRRQTSGGGVESHPEIDHRIETLVREIFEAADPEAKDNLEYSQRGLFFILDTMERVALRLIEQTLALTKEQRVKTLSRLKTLLDDNQAATPSE